MCIIEGKGGDPLVRPEDTMDGDVFGTYDGIV